MEPKIKELQGRWSGSKIPIAIVMAALIIAAAWVVRPAETAPWALAVPASSGRPALEDAGHILPLAAEQKMLRDLVGKGVIDPAKLPKVSELNLLWAYGLANKNPILENGPIADARYGGPQRMAAVGGWTVSSGSAMDHYGMHGFMRLSPDKQQDVEDMAKAIYRPCCNNAAYFPDCNHGMAMLGLLEYLAGAGATADELWAAAASANIAWFPAQYEAISLYLKQHGAGLESVTPKQILGAEYSSGAGFKNISSKIILPAKADKAQDCSVGNQPARAESSSCGV